jgi:hypothetical protein
MEPSLKRVATQSDRRDSVSSLAPDDVIRIIASFSDVFALGALEICCKEMKQVRLKAAVKYSWQRLFLPFARLRLLCQLFNLQRLSKYLNTLWIILTTGESHCSTGVA